MAASLSDARNIIATEIAASIERQDEERCALWCANIYRACLSYDPGQGFRQYKTDDERVEAIGSQVDVTRAVLATVRRLGWREIQPKASRVGDFGIVRTTRGIICVIKDRSVWVTKTKEGFTTFPHSLIARAYRINLYGR